MEIDDFKGISGVNFEKLPSGKFRVKIGKRITGGKVIRKTGDEVFVCRLVKEYVDAWNRNRDSSIYITDFQRGDAMKAFKVLQENEVNLSLVELARTHCARIPKHKNITCRVACDNYLLLLQKKKRSAKYVRLLVTYFNEFCHLYGSKPLYEISSDEIEEWLDVACLGKSDKTYNARLTCMHSVFSLALKKKWVVEDVCSEIEKMSLVPSVVGVFSASEFEALLQAAFDLKDWDLLLLFAIQGLAGLRKSEVIGLKWGNIGKGSIRVIASNAKTNRGRGVELQQPLALILGLFPKWRDKGYDDEHVVTLKNVFARKSKIMKKANVPTWPHNALRHSYCSYRLAITKDTVKTSYEVGNSPVILRSSYDAVVDDIEALKWFLVKVKS